MLQVYFDLEATGLNCWHEFIFQIGACVFSKENDADLTCPTFEEYAKPPKAICEVVEKITHISNDMVKDAAPVREVILNFFQWIDLCRKETGISQVSLLAYNGKGYDFCLLFSEARRSMLNIELLLSSSNVKFLVDPLIYCRKHVDDLKLLRRDNGSARRTLGCVHQALLGCVISDAHTAKADACALQAVCAHPEFADMTFTTEKEENSNYCMDVHTYLSKWFSVREAKDRERLNKTDKKMNLLAIMRKKKRKQANGLSRVNKFASRKSIVIKK